MTALGAAEAAAEDAAKLTGGRAWVKWAVIALAVAIGAYIVGSAAYHAIYYGRDVRRAQGNAETARDIGHAATQTGQEAANTVTRTYEYHTQVDHVVKEAQDHVDAASDVEGADAAGADELCRMHNDLCRAGPAAAP